MATFLLEVGTEELPASFIDDARAQWQKLIPASLADYSLAATTIDVYGTPRRLALLIQGLPLQQPDREEEIKGPPAQAAYQNGEPTKAAIGFAQKQGVSLQALEVRPTDKGDFVFVRKTSLGRPTARILMDVVPQWITSLEGRRFMRWGEGDLRFPRPIRWLVAMLDDAVLPIDLVNGPEVLTSQSFSPGHRVLHPQPIELTFAQSYLEDLRSVFVEVDGQHRRQKIASQVIAAAKQVNGETLVDLSGVLQETDLLGEVANLVEWPTAIVGRFDDEFLELPAEVIITVMVTHQRYFPVFARLPQVGQPLPPLLPYFITLSNGDPQQSATIAAGNERVIRARLSDARFFYQADRAISLEQHLPKLETVTFQEDLGTVAAKVQRIVRLAGQMADQLAVTAAERQSILRSALLCKADLVTEMVGEFPELQGVMGEKYALACGETEAVAIAIVEHYLPRSASDQLPRSLAGRVVGMADRLDTLVSIFGLGLLPSGSSDPFALRRAANSIIKIVWGSSANALPDLNLNLSQHLQQATADFASQFPTVLKVPAAELLQLLEDFFLQRIRTLLQEEEHIDYDLVNAVLGDRDPEYTQRALTDLLDVRDRARFLQQIRQNGHLSPIYETVNRSTRLAAQGDLPTAPLDPTGFVLPQLFRQPSEQAFYDALVTLVPQTQAARDQRDYQRLVTALTAIIPTVSRFFDGPDSVLVMDNDGDVRRNRLNLLGLLRNHARVLGDFGAIVLR